MSRNYEASLNINPVSPEQALEKSVEVGLLDIVNIERINGKYTNVEGRPGSIILPSLRILDDFKIGGQVWVYDIASKPSFIPTTVIDKNIELNLLVLGEKETSEYSSLFPPACKLTKPYYYGLWRASDIEIISEFNATNSGKRRLGPSFLIGLANTLAEASRGITSADETTIYLTNRKLGTLMPGSF